MVLSAYCSGSIQKGAGDKKKLCWSNFERAAVEEGAEAEVVFLNPDDPITDPDNTLGQFGRDIFQVWVAHAVIVDARERRGIGIGVEMAAAAAFGTPVIVVSQRNSKYRADSVSYRGVTVRNYIHPHIAALASRAVDDFETAGRELRGIQDATRGVVPGWLEPALKEYEKNLLPKDEPMLQALVRLNS